MNGVVTVRFPSSSMQRGARLTTSCPPNPHAILLLASNLYSGFVAIPRTWWCRGRPRATASRRSSAVVVVCPFILANAKEMRRGDVGEAG